MIRQPARQDRRSWPLVGWFFRPAGSGRRARREGARTPGLNVSLRIGSVALLIGLWQWYGMGPGRIATPPPTQVFPALWNALFEHELLARTLGTLLEVVVGLAISLVVGLLVGFAIAVFPWARDTLDPLVDAVYAMPVTLLIPFIGVYTGLGFRGRIFIVFMYVAVVIVINTSVGVREVSRDLLETARSYCCTGFSLWRRVLFPAALAHIAAGFSLGVARAVRGAVTAELLLATANLGGFLVKMQSQFKIEALLAGILWTLLLGYALYSFALWLEQRMTPWRRAVA